MRAETLILPAGKLEAAWWGPMPEAAPTLVLLHEGLGSVELWRDVPDLLAAATGWGVLAYSRFGYGQSDAIALPRPMTYMQQEACLVLPQVLRAAGVRQAVLIGHSDGGSIAAVYGGESGRGAFLPSARNVDDQGLLSPTNGIKLGRPVDNAAELGRDAERAVRPVERADPAASANMQLLGLITIAAHFFVEDLNIANIRRIRQDYATGGLRQRLARYHRNVDIAFHGWNDAWLDPRFRDFDITGFLPDIGVPVLGLQGVDDPYGTDAQLHVLRANTRPPAEIVLMKNARHAPHLEAKEATLAAITRFVAGLPRDAPR